MYDVNTSRVVYTRTWVLNALTATGLLICGVVLSTLQTTIYADGGQAVSYWAKLIVAFGISPWSFLLTWAGFYKLMECLALMWGLKLPASFNAPFGRTNLSEFWANWNMTVTSVFRDYLFYSRWRQQTVSRVTLCRCLYQIPPAHQHLRLRCPIRPRRRCRGAHGTGGLPDVLYQWE